MNDCLDVLAGCVATARFDRQRMREALARGFVDATEIADWLAARGVPFREAHHVAGRLVRACVERRVTLAELGLEELRAEHAAFDASVYEALDPEVAVERRALVGGPARARVREEIEALRARLAARGVDADALAADAGVRA